MENRKHSGEQFPMFLHFFLLFTFFFCILLYDSYHIQEKQVESVRNLNSKKIDVEQEHGKKQIALTFDDGPHPVYTEKLLEGLKKRGVHATFFVTGANAEIYPQLVKREQEEGHLIGNHTYSHLQLTSDNREKFKEELQKTNEIIEEITKQKVGFVRPPYGAWDKSLEEELNMIPVLWNIDPLDWCSDDADCITRNVVAKVGENSIILMHDQYESTVTATFCIIDELQKRGYTFVTVEEILFD